MSLRRFVLALLAGMLMMVAFPTSAQDSNDIVRMVAEPGYDHYFRPEYWMPVRINVRNEGSSISGRLVVRPETSGRVVSNSYSTPIDLPSGSEKTVFLYIQARTFPNRILVELVDNEGVRVADQGAAINGIQAHDALHVVVSNLDANTIPLNAVAPGGYRAYEAAWEPDAVPPSVAALYAINTLIFYDVNSDLLTVDQRDAVTQWVAMGGHLIVIGGARWQETTAALADLLPMVPTDGQSISDVTNLAIYAGDLHTQLAGRTFAATGTVQEGARVLAQTGSGIPLLVRRTFGAGTVDLLTVDPTVEPLRSWDQLSDMWFTVLASANPQPGWTRGFLDTQESARAIAILPDIELLPSPVSMFGYILGYILLIGPLNYMLLSRLNKREWAWVSIPLLIVVFTGFAWSVGFNLRGSEIIVSRVNVTQSFIDTATARYDQLIGILSPRRDTYSMTVPERRFLQVMPGLAQNNFLQQTITQSTSDIVQSENFSAENIAIDGGIFANFATSGVIQAANINGTINLIYDSVDGGQLVRGVIRNDGDITLEDAVLVTRSYFYRLPAALEPGDIVNFSTSDMTAIREISESQIPNASPFETVYELDLGNDFRNSVATYNSLEMTRLILGDELVLRRRPVTPSNETEEQARRRALLRAFMRDQYGASGIGHSAYLIGWSSDELAPDVQLGDTVYQPVDTMLHIIQLHTIVEQLPANETVTINPDQFTWAVRTRQMLPDPDAILPFNPSVLSVEGGINDMTLVNRSYIDVRFMPLPEAILDEVGNMTVILDRSSSYGRDVAVLLWDWNQEEWIELENRAREIYEIPEPARFVGPNNMVDMRMMLLRDVAGSPASARIRSVKLIQQGHF